MGGVYRDYQEKIIVLNNPLSFYPNKVSKLDNKKVISLGRLTGQKGYDILIKVWEIISKKHPDWELEIYGEGIERKNLEHEINRLNLVGKIRLMGLTKEPDKKLLESSIYVMSSRFEGMPMVLLEAMACGLPLVSFDCPCGPKDIIQENENGFICEFGNIEQMAERINYLIENESERKRIGKNSRVMSLNYSKEKIMKEWKKLYEN